MVYKVFGALIIGAAVALALLTFQDELGLPSLSAEKTATAPCVQLTPAQQLNKLINDDFKELGRQQQLPAEWAQIATVEYRMNSELAKALLGKSRPAVQRVKDGTTYLELEIVDLPDDVNPGIIIQASLFDIKTKNKIFEVGRTYTMLDLNDPAAAAAAKTAEEAVATPPASATPAATAPVATPPNPTPSATTTPTSAPTTTPTPVRN